jgi:hypothetical protein
MALLVNPASSPLIIPHLIQLYSSHPLLRILYLTAGTPFTTTTNASGMCCNQHRAVIAVATRPNFFSVRCNRKISTRAIVIREERCYWLKDIGVRIEVCAVGERRMRVDGRDKAHCGYSDVRPPVMNLVLKTMRRSESSISTYLMRLFVKDPTPIVALLFDLEAEDFWRLRILVGGM